MRKFIANLLLTVLVSLLFLPMPNHVSASDTEMSLYEFLKTTKNIKASYEYPNNKIAATSVNKSNLLAHTPIVVKNLQTISTKEFHSGDVVRFSVVNDVKDEHDNILIKAGSLVEAQISFIKDKGMLGNSGEITIRDFHTTAVDGTYIPLSGTISEVAEDKIVKTVVLSVLICPLFLLMKGEDAEIPENTSRTIYTISGVSIKLNKI